MTGPDPRACAAWLQASVPLVRMPPPHVERLAAPPREHKPVPTCADGGPHRYPPGRDIVCEDCGVGPGANAVAGLRRITTEHAERQLSEAFG